MNLLCRDLQAEQAVLLLKGSAEVKGIRTRILREKHDEIGFALLGTGSPSDGQHSYHIYLLTSFI